MKCNILAKTKDIAIPATQPINENGALKRRRFTSHTQTQGV